MANHASLIRFVDGEGNPVKRRGRNFIEFDLGGGVIKHVTTIDPLHIRNSETEIDTTWGVGDAVYQWKITAADYISEAKSLFNGAPLVRYTNRETGAWVSLQPRQLEYNNDRGDVQLIAAAQAVTATSDGDAILTWAGAFGNGIDYRWINHPERLLKHLILQNSGVLPTPTDQILTGGNPVLRHQFQFAWSSGMDVYIGGVLWDMKTEITTSERIEFKISDTLIAYFSPASVWDAEDNVPSGVVQRVSKSGNNLLVGVRVPIAWLQSAVYPVIIDPTFTDGYGGDVTTYCDTCMASGQPNNNRGATLYWSGTNTLHSAIIRFDLSSISGTATCDSATLYLYTFGVIGGDRTATFYSIAAANDGWIEGTKNNAAADAGEPCWNYHTYDTQAWAGTAGCHTSGTDYEASALGSIAQSDSEAAGTEHTTALTASRVEDWFDDPNTNYGVVMFGSSDTYSSGFYSSDEATTGYRPKLVVVYTEGGTTITPPFASLGCTATAPTVVKGNVTISPAYGAAGVEAIAPTVVKGSVTIIPAFAGIILSAIAPGIVLGGTTITPPQAEAGLTAIAPTKVFGSVSIVPAYASLALMAVAPKVLGVGTTRRIKRLFRHLPIARRLNL